MSISFLESALSDRLYQYFSSFPHRAYEAEVRRFIFEFLQTPITRESHTLMISALYSRPYKDSFWQQYWETFTSKLINPSSVSQAIDLFSCWFTSLPNEFRPRYVVQ